MLTVRMLKYVLAFCIGAVMCALCIQFAPVNIDIQMRTMEKGSLQYFFDTGGGFNEAQSRSIPLSGSPVFSRYSGPMPASGLRAIRVDPISAPGMFEIRGIKIDYLFWQRQWTGQEELTYLIQVNDVEVKPTAGGRVLAAQALGNDPNFSISAVEDIREWQLIATMFSTLIGGVVGLLIFGVTRHLGGGAGVLAYQHAPLAIVVLVAALVRIIYWWNSGLPSEPSQMGRLYPDEGTYFSIAQYIMTHGLMDYFFAEQSVMVAPGNPAYIALVYTVTNSVSAVRTVNFTLSVLTVALIYKLGESSFNRPVGLLAAGICAIHWQLIEYSATLLTEPLFLFVFIAGMHFLVRAIEMQSVPRLRYQIYAFAAAVFVTIAILTRSIALLLPVVLLVVIGLLDAYRGKREEGWLSFPLLKRAALPLILPIFVVGIVATKNFVIFDRFMVATGSGASLWLGSRADTEGDEPPYRGLAYDTLLITQGASHLSIKGDMLLMEAAKKNILANPLDYLWWNVKKIGRLLVGSNLVWFYPHINIEEWYRGTGRDALATVNLIFQIVLATGVAVFGLIGLVMARGRGLFVLISFASVGYLIIFSIPFLVNQRYGLPLAMLLVIPASAVIYRAWNGVGNYRKAVLIGVIMTAGIVLQVIRGGD